MAADGPPRVLQLMSSAGFHGAETLTLELVEQLRRLEVDTSLLVFRNRQAPNVEVAEAARRRGLPCSVLECGGRIDPAALRRLRRTLCEREIDILHSHEAKSNIYSLAATPGTGARTVATCHNWIGTGGTIRFYNTLDKLLLRFVDRVVAVSDSVRDEALAFGARPERVRRVDNAVDPDRFRPDAGAARRLRDELGLDPAAPVVGTVCRLSAEKNLEMLFEGFRVLCRGEAVPRLLVVGDGEHRAALERRAAELGIADGVRFLGARSDVPRLLSVFDVFAMTSRREGMPMVLLEAMAAGVPVVATRVGGIPRLVDDGRSGLLVAPDDLPGLIRALDGLLDDPQRRRRLGDAGAREVRRRFSSERMARRYLELYGEVLRR